MPPGWLWPALDNTSTDEPSEVVGFYPHRSDSRKHLWLDLLVAAKDRIDILSNASLFLPEDNPDSINIIRHKAESGIPVRIDLGDPETPAMKLRGHEERLGDALIGRIRMALAYYNPLVGVPASLSTYTGRPLYSSIFRYDDQMLINQQAYGIYGYMAPILHLRQVDGANLFNTYLRSFELVWEESHPYTPSTS